MPHLANASVQAGRRGRLVVVALSMGACAPPPAPAAPAEARAAAEVAAPAAAAPDTKAAEACFATANAKRARYSGEPDKVTVKHVLVKYAGAKNADASIHRSRGEACLRAMEARDKMRGGADIADVVKEYSDEPGAATREGSIGTVERKDLAKPFADAAFELSVSQMSDVVETDFGFHVILRTR